MKPLGATIFKQPAAVTRLATLPATWSSVLAGWWLAQGRQMETPAEVWEAAGTSKLLLILIGLSVAWLGWALAEGSRDDGSAVAWKAAWFPLPGLILTASTGPTAATLAGTLFAILLAIQIMPASSLVTPAFAGLVRLTIYLTAATAAPDGVNGWTIWGGLVAGAFVAGVEFMAREERISQRPQGWPLPLLAAPLVLAWVINTGPWREGSILLSAVLVLWLARCIRRLFWPAPIIRGSRVEPLLAGIPLVDWLAASDAPRASTAIFVPVFLAILALQHYLPRPQAPDAATANPASTT